jgi:hypothetical protein
VHASVWTFAGDPQELAAAYDRAVATLPADAMRLHACLLAPDGLVVVDTCPDEATFQAVAPRLRALMAEHGLPEPEVRHMPVHAAFAGGRRVD